MKKGEILRGPPCSRFDVLALDDLESANPRADKHAGTVGDVFRDLETRLRHRLLRRGKGVVDEAPHLARFLLLDKLERVEVLNLGGKGDRETGGVKALDGSHAAGAGQ